MTVFTRSCDQCGTMNKQHATYCVHCGHTLVPVLIAMSTTAGKAQSLIRQRYRIVGKLGRGGMGTVYKALDTQLGDRPVALKEMLLDSLDPQKLAEVTATFKNEALLLARLNNAHLPSIYDFFLEGKCWYIVMSFIEGETLEHYVHTHDKDYLAIDEVLTIGIQLCTVLEYLHAQQPPIIFRDLKLSNIMRTSTGHLYLIDFGIARHFKLGQVKDTIAFGSPGYAAPEQYGRAQTSPQSDIYSLGVILHRLLTGDSPADNSPPFHFKPLNRPSRTYPIKLEELIQHMLEIQPAKRPEHVSIVKQKLSALAQEELEAHPTSILPLQKAMLGPSMFRPISPPVIGTVLCTFNGHTDQITAIAWSPIDNRIASGSKDKTIHIWDAHTGNDVLLYRGHTQAIASLSWSPTGICIASGDFERIIHIWNATLSTQILTYAGHNTLWSGGDAVRALAWSPDGTRIASVSGDNAVHIWDTALGNLLFTYRGHGDAFPVRCVAWSPDGMFIASAAQYCDVWSAATGEKLYSNRSGQTHALTWSPDSTHLAISISDIAPTQRALVKICRIVDGRELQSYEAHTRPAYTLAWSHDGTYIASADNTIHIWDPITGKQIYVYQGHRSHVSSVAWSFDDTRIASGGVDATVHIWQMVTQTP